jgi:hypothetical protein
VRLVFTPVVGLAIANATGLYGPLTPSSAWYWIGTGYFILISLIIWQGNHAFWMKWRGYPDWLSAPMQRLFRLVATSFVYTIPVSLIMLYAWYRMAAFAPPDWRAIGSATLLCVVADLFIKSTYETVHLIRQRARDQLAVEQLARSKAQAELATLKAQIDPHFLFNCLNTLAGLIEEDPERAVGFTSTLADVYRYILCNHSRELVTLREELGFLDNYCSLLRLRFDDVLLLDVPDEPARSDQLWLPPVSLQLLLENAVKHNDFTTDRPLRVEVRLEPGVAVVTNTRQPSARSQATLRRGLRNLDERCRLTLNRGVQVEDLADRFTVRVPVASLEAS